MIGMRWTMRRSFQFSHDQQMSTSPIRVSPGLSPLQRSEGLNQWQRRDGRSGPPPRSRSNPYEMASCLARLPPASAPWPVRSGGTLPSRPAPPTARASGSFGEYFDESPSPPRRPRPGAWPVVGSPPRQRAPRAPWPRASPRRRRLAAAEATATASTATTATASRASPRENHYLVVQTPYRDTVVHPPCDVVDDGGDDAAWGFFLDFDKEEKLPASMEAPAVEAADAPESPATVEAAEAPDAAGENRVTPPMDIPGNRVHPYAKTRGALLDWELDL
ncbi:hypothetical protein JL721_6028 [Aureococcus anophagefferens]|nr:hypothetical protein JL721_6028 [Aureococcus anophagefferens]